MERFETIQAAFSWLANQIRTKGIYQEPINKHNRMDNWSVDEWVWGVFKFQLMDGWYSTRHPPYGGRLGGGGAHELR